MGKKLQKLAEHRKSTGIVPEILSLGTQLECPALSSECPCRCSECVCACYCNCTD